MGEKEPRISKEPKQPLDLFWPMLPIARLALYRNYEVEVINPENILNQSAVYAANHVHAVDSLYRYTYAVCGQERLFRRNWY